MNNQKPTLIGKMVQRDMEAAQVTIEALMKEREGCICPCDMQSPFCPLHGINGTSPRQQTGWR